MSDDKPKSLSLLLQLKTPMMKDNLRKDCKEVKDRGKLSVNSQYSFGSNLDMKDISSYVAQLISNVASAVDVPEKLEIELYTCKLNDKSIVGDQSGDKGNKTSTGRSFANCSPTIGDIIVLQIVNDLKHKYNKEFTKLSPKFKSISIRATGGSKLYDAHPLSISLEQRQDGDKFSSLTDWALCGIYNVMPQAILDDSTIKRNDMEPYGYARNTHAISRQLVKDVNKGLVDVKLKSSSQIKDMDNVMSDESKPIEYRVGKLGKRYSVHPTMPQFAASLPHSDEDVIDWSHLNI